MSGLLEYLSGGTVLHRLHPLTKLGCAFVLSASCFITRRPAVVAGIIVLNFVLALLSGGGTGAAAGDETVAHRTLRILRPLVKLAVVLFVVQVLFVREGRAVFSAGGIVITREGLAFSLLFALRLVAATLPPSLVLSVTRPSDLAAALTRTLGLPYKYAFVLTTALRFIPVFSTEMRGIIEAQIARGVDFETKNIVKKLRLLLPLCVPLLMSSVRRVDSAALSAELRGFHFRTRYSGWKRFPFGRNDIAAILLAVLPLAVSFLA
ncbi:MAG: energy-coupling factor transporter transmembrane protein EcfT [Spirochaetaceae bacterium]|jgi:energy-coupling factor transport system permease protein|nr:energy-coupling factor transporter transmembrane protein EcfT [Spirochaetaceae bacterium]